MSLYNFLLSPAWLWHLAFFPVLCRLLWHFSSSGWFLSFSTWENWRPGEAKWLPHTRLSQHQSQATLQHSFHHIGWGSALFHVYSVGQENVGATENVLGLDVSCEKANASVELRSYAVLISYWKLSTKDIIQFISISVPACAPTPQKFCFHENKKEKSKREFSFNDFLFFSLSFSFLVQKAFTLPIHFLLDISANSPLLVVRQLSIISLCILFKIVWPSWNPEVSMVSS